MKGILFILLICLGIGTVSAQQPYRRYRTRTLQVYQQPQYYYGQQVYRQPIMNSYYQQPIYAQSYYLPQPVYRRPLLNIQIGYPQYNYYLPQYRRRPVRVFDNCF